jgi:hypothetical protein
VLNEKLNLSIDRHQNEKLFFVCVYTSFYFFFWLRLILFPFLLCHGYIFFFAIFALHNVILLCIKVWSFIIIWLIFFAVRIKFGLFTKKLLCGNCTCCYFFRFMVFNAKSFRMVVLFVVCVNLKQVERGDFWNKVHYFCSENQN